MKYAMYLVPPLIRYAIIFLFLLILSNCQHSTSSKSNLSNNFLYQLNDELSTTIIEDGFSPPVASRIYAYCNITAYEATRLGKRENKSIVNQLNGFDKLNDSMFSQPYDARVVMVESFCKVAKLLTYRGYNFDAVRQVMLGELKGELSEEIYTRSLTYADSLSQIVIRRTNHDNYKKTRDMPKFEPAAGLGKWRPTGPTFGDALEPYWNLITPFTLDSASHFQVRNYAPFSADNSSAFYKMVTAVLDSAITLKDSATVGDAIYFWDCNPFKTIMRGHVMYRIRQLTPGGHWIGITTAACKKENVEYHQAAKILALTSVAIADAFINCWSEKYRCNLIRPESYIQDYIRKDWTPVLETPLFPELPSGHAFISAAAAVSLTHFFGNNYAYTDSCEVPFGRLPRSFNSFQQAAHEAALSRFYGGIHYKESCLEGERVGMQLGAFVIEKVKL